MRHPFLHLIVFILQSQILFGQCDVSVDVPADLTICSEDEIHLEGIISGTESCFNWVSDHGYFNDSEIGPFVFVEQNTTFTFTAYGSIPGTNLIINGDFESGDDGSFTTDYTQASSNCIHGAGFLGCEGVYEIMNDPSDGHTDFDACDPMGSLQMVVNGAASLQQIWCQDVDVLINRKYQFSAWAQSVNPGSPAQLQFSIDGTQIGNILSLSATTCAWEEILEYWVSPISANIEICITNQNTNAGGNDFAIDDIFFGELCSDEMEFTVEVGDLLIDPTLPDEFDCSIEDMELSLNASSSFTPLTYDWSSPDFNIINDDNDGNAIVFLPGTYIVEVTDALGCTIEHYFDIESNIESPEINLEPNDPIILCDDNFVAIYNDDDQFSYDYYWEWAGTFYSGEDILEAAEPGEYQLTVTDTNNGCTSTASIIVDIDSDIPEIEADFSNAIDCNNPSSQLILNTSEPLTSIEWFDEEGNSVSDLIVTAGGFYFVSVVGENGCVTDDFIEIPALDFDPQLTINTPNIIDCDNPTALLSINVNGIFNLDWSGPNGYTETGNDLIVSEGGIYNLSLSNIDGCTADYFVEITTNLVEPEIQLGPIGVLDCDIQSIPISIINYDLNNQYNWTLPNGSSLNEQNIDATMPGDYTLTVTAPNGCSSDSTINILAAGNLPTLNISANPIDCNNPTSLLIADGSFTTLEWSNASGVITDLEVDTTGWHYAFANNGNGCFVLDSIFVNVDTIIPQQSFNNIDLDCLNPEALLFNTVNNNYSYQWTLPDGSSSLEDSLMVSIEGIYSVVTSSVNGCLAFDTIQVNSMIAEPTFDVSGIDTLSCNNQEITISINEISSIQSTSLTSAAGTQQGSSFNISEAGAYTITAIGENGCTNSFEFEITADTLIEESIVEINNINCLFTTGSLTIINPVQDNNYQWSQGLETGTGLLFETNSSGNVTLATTDQNNGCSIDQVYNIQIDTITPTLTYDVNPLTCVQQEQEIFLSPNGDYQYGWILPDGDIAIEENLIAQDTGDYILVISGDNFCNNQYIINVPGTIDLPEFQVIPPQAIDCNNPTTTISISSLEVLAGFTATHDGFTLSFGNGDLVTDQPGEWSVQATASNGCTNSVDFIVEIDTIPPDPMIGIENINCEDTQGMLSITNPEPSHEYFWLDSFISQDTTSGTTYLLDHQSEVTLIAIGENGCSAEASAAITVDTIAPQFDLITDTISCNNPLAMMQINGPANATEYNWFFEDDFLLEGSFATSDQPGNYLITAINLENNCTSSQSIELLQEPMPVSFDFNLVQPPCGEDDFELSDFSIDGGSGPYSYNLNVDNPVWISSEIEAILNEGDNFIQIQDANGCLLDTTLSLSLPAILSAEIDDFLTLDWGSDTTLNLIVNRPEDEIQSILWTPAENLSCSDCLTPTVTLFEDQFYQIQVIDIFGCKSLVELRIEVLRNLSVYVPNVFTPENQDNNLFFPFGTEQHIRMVDNFYIFDRWGNRIFSNAGFLPNDPSAGWDGTILGVDAVAGVYAYIMEIVYSDGSTELLTGDVTLIR